MERITLRLSPSLSRALEVRAEREHVAAAQIAREALAFHLDRLAIADVYGDRIGAVIDQQLQRTQAAMASLADENARLQQLVRDLLARIEGGIEEPPSETRAPDPREERLLENLIPYRKGTRS